MTASPRTSAFMAPQNSSSLATVAGRLPITRTALSPRPTPMSKRPFDCTAIAPKRLAATDQSRVTGLVTQGPKRSRSVWSMATAICGVEVAP